MAEYFGIMSAAFLAGLLFEAMLLPLLKKLKAGQSIREEGPKAHLAKAGTPTMGGIAIILTVVVIELVALALHKSVMPFSVAICTVAYGLLGFADDYIKVVKHHNEGLTPKQKIAGQLLIAVVFAIYLYKSGHTVFVPFFKVNVDFGIWIIPFAIFVMLAMTNAVNLTDGLDGLCSGVSTVVAVFFAIAAFIRGYADSESFYSMLVLAGACIAFLCYNRHPAGVFMGDTGSLAIGGCIAAAAFDCGCELLLPLAGFVYVAEALSVIIQVFVFKTQNGRRFFRMAPLHHHFELGGMSEVRVVCMFTGATVLLCILAYFGL